MQQRYIVTKNVESSSNSEWYLVFDQRTNKPLYNARLLRRSATDLARHHNLVQEQKCNRLARLQTLRLYGAPRWIVKNEQVKLVEIRSQRERYDLMEKYVRPIMGQGSITVPDTDA